MSDETRANITALLNGAGVAYSAILVQRGAIQQPDTKDGKPWEHDAWEIVFAKSGANSLRVPYKTGIGHRKAPAWDRSIYARSPKTAFDRRQLEVSGRPVAPDAADVLHSLTMDDTRGESFRDWCANYGYDDDSRRALATYELCQRQTDDARRFFGRETFERIAEILQDY
jgi:hypothetical protein